MTVCIAAICREWEYSGIILCSDNRLDQADLGTGHGQKTRILGYQWFAMMSGNWAMANELCNWLSRKIQEKPDFPTREKAFSSIRKMVNDFKRSPFYVDSAGVELIVGGFVSGQPMLMEVGYRDGYGYAEIQTDQASVGSGSAIAKMMMNQRKLNPLTNVQCGMYIAYEAKRFSESASSVGPGTYISLHLPANQSVREGFVNVIQIRGDELNILARSYQRFGLQSIDPRDLLDLMSTRAAELPRQPLLGSPGGTDES
jgi:20S proteasome alpha/beta subunit